MPGITLIIEFTVEARMVIEGFFGLEGVSCGVDVR